MPDGSGYIASLTRMPGVTLEMIEWWFAWHGLESLALSDLGPQRPLSGPGQSGTTGAAPPGPSAELAGALLEHQRFRVGERGEGTSALRISFRSPESFGFDMERFNAQR